MLHTTPDNCFGEWEYISIPVKALPFGKLLMCPLFCERKPTDVGVECRGRKHHTNSYNLFSVKIGFHFSVSPSILGSVGSMFLIIQCGWRNVID